MIKVSDILRQSAHWLAKRRTGSNKGAGGHPSIQGRVPCLVPGQRVYAIGDVHGRLDLLHQLLDLIAADERARAPVPTLLIFLGDLIDRGPDSSGVISTVRALQVQRNVRVLCGNHEDMFLRSIGDNETMRQFLRYGGRETLISYGLEPDALRDMTFEELYAAIADKVPQSDLQFLQGLEDIIQLGDYVFVHAGVRPGVPLDGQSQEDLRWIRSPFLTSDADFGAVIVHGHTMTEQVEIRRNRIGIDSGAYVSGKLTALGLEGAERWFLATGTATPSES
jgi:serine/threonine protein phosphatase 1